MTKLNYHSLLFCCRWKRYFEWSNSQCELKAFYCCEKIQIAHFLYQILRLYLHGLNLKSSFFINLTSYVLLRSHRQGDIFLAIVVFQDFHKLLNKFLHTLSNLATLLCIFLWPFEIALSLELLVTFLWFKQPKNVQYH